MDLVGGDKNELSVGQTKTRLQFFFQNAPVAYQSLDKNGCIIEINNSWLTTLGYIKEDVVGKCFSNFLVEADKELFFQRFQRFKELGIVKNVEFVLVAKDGSHLNVSFDGEIEFDANGDFVCTHCVFQNVTKLKETESAFEESEKRIRALLNASTESVFLMELDGTFLEMNKITASRFGKKVEDLLGTCAYDILPADVVQKRKKAIEKVVETKKSIRLTDVRNGIVFDNNVFPIFDSDNNVHRVAIFAKDLTAQRKAEHEVEERKEMFRLLAENSKDLIFKLALIPENKFIYVSPSSFDIIGYTPEEHYNDPQFLLKIIHPEDLDTLNEIIVDKKVRDKPTVLRWIKKDGSIIWLEHNITRLFDPEGNVIEIDGVARDVTDRVEEARISQQISKLNKDLIVWGDLPDKLKRITDALVETVDADFARIWLVKPNDLVDYRNVTGLNNAGLDKQGDYLHLMSSSGRYTAINGKYSVIQIGQYRIGQIASGQLDKIVTNDLLNDEYIKEKEWVKKIGLKSFVGYAILSDTGKRIGVLGMFFKKKVTLKMEEILESFTSMATYIIQTALKQEDLKESVLKLHEAVKATNVGLWDWDLVNNEVSYSSTWKKQIGYEDHEIEDDFEEWRIRVHPDDLQGTLDKIDECLKDPNKPFITEFRFKHKNGHYKWIYAQASILVNDEGKPWRFVGSHLDITERKKSENRIKENELRYRALIETAPSIILNLSPTGDIWEFNSEAEKVYRVKRQDVLGKNFLETFVDDSRVQKLQEQFENALKGESIRDFECVFCTPEKEKVTISWNLNRIEDNGNTPTGITCIGTDISRRKIMEHELEEANTAKDKFFSIVGHDLRGPLSTVLQLVKHIESDFAELDDEVKIELLTSISKSMENTYNLLENILLWSRSQRNRVELDIADFELTEFIEENISLVIHTAEGKSIKIVNNVTNNLKVFADIQSCNTILRNLLSNAIKFTHRGGEIELTDRVVVENDNSFIEISVIDNGVGMSEKRISNIFSLDQDITTKGTANETGTGLGLILCKDFAEKNGGGMCVSSEIDKGSTFSFTMPVYSGEQ